MLDSDTPIPEHSHSLFWGPYPPLAPGALVQKIWGKRLLWEAPAGCSDTAGAHSQPLLPLSPEFCDRGLHLQAEATAPAHGLLQLPAGAVIGDDLGERDSEGVGRAVWGNTGKGTGIALRELHKGTPGAPGARETQRELLFLGSRKGVGGAWVPGGTAWEMGCWGERKETQGTALHHRVCWSLSQFFSWGFLPLTGYSPMKMPWHLWTDNFIHHQKILPKS